MKISGKDGEGTKDPLPYKRNEYLTFQSNYFKLNYFY